MLVVETDSGARLRRTDEGLPPGRSGDHATWSGASRDHRDDAKRDEQMHPQVAMGPASCQFASESPAPPDSTSGIDIPVGSFEETAR
jgi:hypothetical protein